MIGYAVTAAYPTGYALGWLACWALNRARWPR